MGIKDTFCIHIKGGKERKLPSRELSSCRSFAFQASKRTSSYRVVAGSLRFTKLAAFSTSPWNLDRRAHRSTRNVDRDTHRSACGLWLDLLSHNTHKTCGIRIEQQVQQATGPRLQSEAFTTIIVPTTTAPPEQQQQQMVELGGVESSPPTSCPPLRGTPARGPSAPSLSWGCSPPDSKKQRSKPPERRTTVRFPFARTRRVNI